MTDDAPDGTEVHAADDSGTTASIDDGTDLGDETGDEATAGDDTDADAGAAADEVDETVQVGLVGARSVALEEAETVLSDPVDNVIEVTANGDDWLVVIEVVERSAVPDTQDILARYEFRISAGGQLTGFSLVERYKRGDLRGDL